MVEWMVDLKVAPLVDMTVVMMVAQKVEK